MCSALTSCLYSMPDAITSVCGVLVGQHSLGHHETVECHLADQHIPYKVVGLHCSLQFSLNRPAQGCERWRWLQKTLITPHPKPRTPLDSSPITYLSQRTHSHTSPPYVQAPHTTCRLDWSLQSQLVCAYHRESLQIFDC